MSRVMVRFFLLGTLLVGTFLLTKSATLKVQNVRAQSTLRPFRAERWAFARSAITGTDTLVLKEITAANSQGSLVTISSAAPDPTRYVKRKIQRIDGLEAIVVDDLRMVSSGYTTDLRPLSSRSLYAQAGCVVQDRKESVLGKEQIVGITTIIVQRNTPKEVRSTAWRAPEMGCFALKIVNERLQPDGSYMIVSEYKPVKADVGTEPETTLFDIPAEYEELRPSDLLKRLAAHLGFQYPPEALSNLDRLDAEYLAPKSKP